MKRAMFRQGSILKPRSRCPKILFTYTVVLSSLFSQCRTTKVTPRARETSSPNQEQAAASAGPAGAASHGRRASSSGPPAAAARGRERDGRASAARASRTAAAAPSRRAARCWSRCASSTTCRRCAGRASCAPSGRRCAECARRPGFRVIHYSIQDDHAHFIVEAARFARCVNRVFGRKGRVLADRFHHVLKRTPTEVRRALA